MGGRRRPATRRTGSVEPTGGHVSRQTRQSARRPEPSAEPESQQPPESSRRSASRRGGRKSPVNVATDISPEHAFRHGSSDPENPGLLPVKGSTLPRNDSLSETGDAHESSEMDADRIQDMLDFDIPKLTRWSDKLYGILSSLGRTQLDVDGRAKLNSYRKSYNHARLPFADSNMPFIKHIYLPEEYGEAVQSKIYDAVCSGNIVSLLISLSDLEWEQQVPHAIFRQLDDTFPASFISLPQVDSGDAEKVFGLAVRIRCYRLIELLESGDSIASPEEYLTSATTIFCRESIDDADQARNALDQGPYKPLAGMEISEGTKFHRDYCQSIKEFSSNVDLHGTPKFHASPDSMFTQESIFHDIKSWALEMYQRLNGLADRNKIRPTSEGVSSRMLIERAESEPLFVKNIDATGGDSDSASDTDAGGYNQLPLHGPNESYINSPATLAAVRKSEGKALMRLEVKSPSNQQAQKGKGKVSGTRDAIRLLEPGQVLDRTRKRPHPEGGSNDEDDGDDFEVNEQFRGESRRVLSERATTQRPSSARPRFSKQSQSRKPRELSPRASSPGGISSAQPPDGLQDGYDLQDRDILVLSQNARNSRRAGHSTKPRQVRIPWSAHDTSRLVDLIADPSLNCSWSAMEKANGFQHQRNQQALRDKARGLKVWYLEGDRILPPGFDQVALGQKEKASVIKCGRNPDRREDDVDEDGHVTNNLWVE
ncbi:hypothetical protein F5B19DRAFT_497421 [Rostrohypoxylon terebratum]|nr:hypothetical protein F5B19DRAFT_497421 [Rostrohypoxylon terebratum]